MCVQLNHSQKQLVEAHLWLVPQVILTFITVSNSVCGVEYEDLYQEGCLLLCKAAIHFCPEREATFATFARKVVFNGLKTYCRLMNKKQKSLVVLPSFSDAGEATPSLEQFPASDQWEDVITKLDALILLDRLKPQYQGSTRLGVEALQWKIKGYTGAQIAALYGVKPNLVGAWISKAKKRLFAESSFCLWARQFRFRD